MHSNRMIIIQNDGTTLFVHPCWSDYTYMPISLIILDYVLSMYWFSSWKLPPTLLISVQLAVSSFWLLMADHNIGAFLFHTFLFHFRCIFCPYLPIWKVFSFSWLPHNGTFSYPELRSSWPAPRIESSGKSQFCSPRIADFRSTAQPQGLENVEFGAKMADQRTIDIFHEALNFG